MRLPGNGFEPREDLECWESDPDDVASRMMFSDVFDDESDRLSNVFSTNAQRSTAPPSVSWPSRTSTCSSESSCARLTAPSSSRLAASKSDGSALPSAEEAMDCGSIGQVEKPCPEKPEVGAKS